MKRSYFLPLISGAIILFLSGAAVVESAGTYSWTGSPVDGGVGSGGQCSHCHNGGTSGIPTLSLTSTPAFGGSGSSLTYSANTTYTITISPVGNYGLYGFNCEIINSQSASTSSVTTFGAFGVAVTSNCKLYTAAQDAPYPACASHNSTTAGPWSFSWTAPASGTGFIYADVNGVNGNAATSGDQVSGVYCYTLTPAAAAGIETEKNNVVNLIVFPNPAIDNITITFNKAFGTKIIQLFDITGKLVLEKNTADASTQVDLTSVTKGTYFVKVLDDSKNVVAVKMIMVTK